MDLKGILKPPLQPQEHIVDWDMVQGALQTPLPVDYKDFIERYGTGRIDGFLWVLSPVADNPNINLLKHGRVILRTLRDHRTAVASSKRPVPFAAFPEPGGLLPWGYTDNGDACYWKTGDADPNLWRVVVNDGRGSMWEQFEGSMTTFLGALLSRRHESQILTDEGFPSHAVRFDSGDEFDD
jgi:hypothetical protein